MAIEKDYTVKVSTADAVKNVDKLTKAVEEQNDELLIMEGQLLDAERALSKLGPKQLNRIKDTKDYIKQLKQKITLEKKGAKLLSASQKKATKDLVNTKKASVDYSGIVGKLDAQTGGLISGFDGMVKGLKNATKGFKTVKLAIISTGLGALVVIMGALYAAFTSSEEGQKKWAAVMEVVGAVVGVFMDRLADLGSGIIKLFTEPIETLKGFGDSIKEFVMDKIDLAVESLGFMGSAISKLFSGDFSGALEDAGKGVVGLNRALNPAVILTEALVSGTKDLITELSKEAKIAGQIADQRAEADKLDRKLIVDRAEANRKRAELLEKAVDKEKFTTQERIEFLKEAGKLEDEITKQEIEAAQLRLNAKIAENKLGDSTKEDLQEEQQLKADLINLETARLMKQREITGQIIAFNSEAVAADKAKSDEEIANAKAVQDFKDSLRIKDKENKFAEIESEKEARILALEDLKLSETEKQQMILDVEQAFKEKKKLIEEEEAVVLSEEKDAFLEAQLGQEELSLDKQRQMALDELTRFGATEDEKLAINTKYNELETEQDKIKRDAEINMAAQTFGSIANLLGENSKAGKAAAVASALINTYQGITAELATKTATPWGIALKIANIATVASIGFKSVKDIMKTNPKSAGGGGSPSTPSYSSRSASEPTPPMTSIPPEFNTVGASGTNQLANAIGGQSQQPIQTFVVANDVTTSQSLERNIVTGATIG